MFKSIELKKDNRRTENTVLKKSIIKYLKTIDEDLIDWHKTWGNAVEKSGRPDINIRYKGQTYYFELKDPNGDLDTVQKETYKKYKRIGVPVYVIDNIEDFKKIIY